MSQLHGRPANLKRVRGTRISLPPKLGTPDPSNVVQVEDWLDSLPRPWAIDLFAGAGGLSLGLSDAGFSIAAAADHDSTALETHAHNIGGLTWCGDLSNPEEFISQLEKWGIRDVELVAGGPPCQPFSRAGTAKIADLVRQGVREPQDKRADLWKSFLSVIEHLNARAVLIENVPDLARMQKGATLTELLAELESRSYRTYAKPLKSWRFGVPQHRSRLFVVGVKEGLSFEWPEGTNNITTLKQAIGDLPVVGAGQREEVLMYEGRPRTTFARQMRKGVSKESRFLIHDHITRFVRDDDSQIFANMKEGDTYKNVPEKLRRYRSDIFQDKYNRLKWNGLSRTITAHIAKDGYWYIHPSQDRTLSIREAARIQTFPDSFLFAGFPSRRYSQIGNAVPPFLAESVGKALTHIVHPLSIRETSAVYHSSRVRSRLMDWYHKYGRSYPWRSHPTPWATLLAEVCLHRTKADQVANAFPRVIELGHSPRALLDNWAEIQSALSHLGLQWRVDLLFSLAEMLEAEYEGRVPEAYSELMCLPGIGDYIASAVLCFAYELPSILVDTNTSRFIRRFRNNADLSPWEQRLALYELAQPANADPEWNYALLDFGALVCKAIKPHCSTCPIRLECATGNRLSSEEENMT